MKLKLFFLKKGDLRPNIKLAENNELLQNDIKIADELKSFLKYAVLYAVLYFKRKN